MTGTDPFEAFVRKYQDMVFGTAVRLLGNPIEAEDVAQIVFLRAFQRFAEIAASPTAGGWLKTVTRNDCLNHLTRYRARWRLFSEMTSAQERATRNPISPSRPRSPPGLVRARRRTAGSARPPRSGPAAPARSPARPARALSHRGHELPEHRRHARRFAGQGQDRHPPRARGAQAAVERRRCIPLNWSGSSIAS